MLVVLILAGAVQFANRAKNWQRGGPDNRATTVKNVGRRLADFRAGVYMHTLLREPAAGIMHSLIYFSFLILLAVTTTLEIDHQMPESAKFLHGGVYKGYSAVGDIAGALLLIGILWAIGRRYGPRNWRPYRIRIKTKPEHAVILGTFFVIAVSGFFTEAFRIALAGRPDHEKWSVIGYPLSYLFRNADHLLGLAPRAVGHARDRVHRVPGDPADDDAAPHVHVAAQHVPARQGPAQGRDEAHAQPHGDRRSRSFGAATIEDFTWKQLLDTDACTMCGRCTSVCPAHATGKPLDPREIVLKIGEVMAATGDPVVSPPVGMDKEITIGANSRVRAHHGRRGVGVHHVQGVRRDLPGQHRDPRQDPRHAPLPVADGVQLPHRTRQRLPSHGEPGQSVGARAR